MPTGFLVKPQSALRATTGEVFPSTTVPAPSTHSVTARRCKVGVIDFPLELSFLTEGSLVALKMRVLSREDRVARVRIEEKEAPLENLPCNVTVQATALVGTSSARVLVTLNVPVLDNV
jgi:hypothetical protein